MTVLVGSDKKSFHIHKALLSSKSTYFRAAFEGSFKEAEEKTLHLVDEDPDYFACYTLWIYNQPLENITSDIERKPSLDDYCHLFVLADKLGSEPLQNLVMDIIHEYASDDGQSGLDPRTVNFVWASTMPGSQLRAILIDFLAWQQDLDKSPELVEAEPEFLFEVLKICSRRLPWRLVDEVGPFEKDKCQTYHTHRDGSGPCVKVVGSGLDSDKS